MFDLQAAADFDISPAAFHLDGPSAFRLIISVPVLDVAHDNHILQDVAQSVHHRVVVLSGSAVGINGLLVVRIENRTRRHIVLIPVRPDVLLFIVPEEFIERGRALSVRARVYVFQESFIRGEYQAVSRVHRVQVGIQTQLFDGPIYHSHRGVTTYQGRERNGTVSRRGKNLIGKVNHSIASHEATVHVLFLYSHAYFGIIGDTGKLRRHMFYE